MQVNGENIRGSTVSNNGGGDDNVNSLTKMAKQYIQHPPPNLEFKSTLHQYQARMYNANTNENSVLL